MTNRKYFETIALCTGAQHKKDVPNWTTIHDFDKVSNNKDFDASIFKQGNRLVIAFAGTDTETGIKKSDDVQNDVDIFKNKIPSQYFEAHQLIKTTLNLTIQISQLMAEKGMYFSEAH